MTIQITAYKCPECLDLIYSRCSYDYRQCSCGASAVDTGVSYDIEGGDIGVAPNRLIGAVCGSEHVILCVDTDKQGLYDDWNNQINKYGSIRVES